MTKINSSINLFKKYLLPHKKEIIFISILGCISALTNGSIPFVTGLLLDNLIKTINIEILNIGIPLVFVILITWLVIQIIAYFVDWKNNYEADRLSLTIYTEYLSNGVNHLINLPLSFHTRYKTGEINSKIQRTGIAFYGITNSLVIITPQILTIIVALIIVFFINWIMTLFLITGLIFYIVVFGKIINKAKKLEKVNYKNWNKIFGDSWDAIYNIKTIKSFTTEEYEAKKINKGFLKKALWSDIAITKMWNDLGFYQRITILITQTTIFILSIYFINQNLITIGQLVAFNGYSAILFGPFIILGRQWQNFQNGLVFGLETEKILNLSKEPYEPKNGIELKKFQGEIEFKNVSFFYEKNKPVLENISFVVKPGEVIALVGKSGEGKSTLIDLISGYHFASKGKIFIDGIDIKKLKLKSLRKNIALVPQEVVLFNETVKNNIVYGNFKATQKEIDSAALQSHSLEFINKFPKKWDQVVGERGVKLSVGQKQRIAIARAILKNPKILVLDEPTSALDAESENYISKSLNTLMKNKTTFIIAHRLSTVRKADKIMVIQNKKIVEIGNHQELISKPDGVYKNLYELQIGLHD